MPWKDMIEVSPEEKDEALDAVVKARKRVDRATKRLEQLHTELNDAIVHAYPRVPTRRLTKATGMARQRIWLIVQEHDDQGEAVSA